MPAPMGHEPYVGSGRHKIYTQEMIESEADSLYEWINQDERNIFIEEFCLLRGYSYKRLNEWTNSNEKFSEVYDIFKTKQMVALFKGGLSKRFNYPMCALILSHRHGIYQKTEQTIVADMSTRTILDEISDQTKDLIHE